MPWPYADQAGIVKKWADKYNIDIKIVQADYVETINQFTAAQREGVDRQAQGAGRATTAAS